MSYRLFFLLAAGIGVVTPSCFAENNGIFLPMYGVAVHYIPSKSNISNFSKNFDVNRFANDLESCGVGYVMVTLGQNTGAYLTPNDKYISITKQDPDLVFPSRDIVYELANRLSENNKTKLFFYLPIRGPQYDKQALSALDDADERSVPSSSFVKNWSEVVKFWSLKYSEQISGWWFDGAYVNRNGMWSPILKSAKIGNKDSLVALNSGQGLQKAFAYLDSEQNYTAGELKNLLDILDIEKPVKNGFHVFSYLGSDWGKIGVRYSRETIEKVFRKVVDFGGMMTLDVHVDDYGVLDRDQLSVICNLPLGGR